MPCIHIHLSKEDNKASGMEITVKVIIEEDFSKKKRNGKSYCHMRFYGEKNHILKTRYFNRCT